MLSDDWCICLNPYTQAFAAYKWNPVWALKNFRSSLIHNYIKIVQMNSEQKKDDDDDSKSNAQNDDDDSEDIEDID